MGLRTPPQWLRAVALSYPMLRPFGQVSGCTPVLELAAATRLPILLTRVGREFPDLAAAQDDFVHAAETHHADLTVIEIPDAHHAFDVVDDTDESREAIADAVDFLRNRLI
jgi:dienelactone hydrolase